MGKGGEMSSGKGDESGGYENPNYPVVIGEDGVPRIGPCAVDPLQNFKATEIQLWPIFGNKLSFARPHMRAFHFQWLSFFVAFMAWFAYAPLLVIIRQDLDISTRRGRRRVGPHVHVWELRSARLPSPWHRYHIECIPHARHQHPGRRVALPQ